MFSRKSSVATIENSAHNLVIYHSSRESRRHSAAPFSLAAILSEADTKYHTLDLPRHNKVPSTYDSKTYEQETTPYDKTFLIRIGRRLHTLLPKAPPSDIREPVALRIGMQKEVQVVAENRFEEPEHRLDNKHARSPILRMRASEESIHKSTVNGPRIPLIASVNGPKEKRMRRKPAQLSLTYSNFRTNVAIEREEPGVTEPEHTTTALCTRSCLADSSSTLQPAGLPAKIVIAPVSSTPQSYTTKTTPLPPIPPRSPMRNQRVSRQGNLLSPTKLSTAVTPANRAVHIQSFGNVFKSLFRRRGEKGKLAHGKKAAAIIVRKTSLTRQRSKPTVQVTKLSYQPHSSRTTKQASLPASTQTKISNDLVTSTSQLFGHRRRASLPSFLSISSP